MAVNTFPLKQATVAVGTALILLARCKRDTPLSYLPAGAVVVVVWDGVRFSDLWADGRLPHTPWLRNSLSKGVFYPIVWHEGYTYTMAGHLALLSGNHIPIDNSGREIAPLPTLLHKVIAEREVPWWRVTLISTKSKLCALAYCKECKDTPPLHHCGHFSLLGKHSDKKTLQRALEVIERYQPAFMVVAFAEADIKAHQGDSLAYLEALRNYDELTAALWQHLQQHTAYANHTTLLITTDHGRHTYNFRGHGDGCAGCRRLFAFWLTPHPYITLPPPTDTLPMICLADLLAKALKVSL